MQAQACAQGHAEADPRQAQRAPLDRALDDEGTRKRLLELGSVLPDKNGSEIARWMAIIQVAGP